MKTQPESRESQANEGRIPASRNQYSGSGDFSPEQEGEEFKEEDLGDTSGLDPLNHPQTDASD